MRRLIALFALVGLLVIPGTAFATTDYDSSDGTMPAMADQPTIFLRQDPTYGTYFTDQSGRALYVYSKDTTPGQSTCYDKCATAWPIFTANGDLSLPGGDSGKLSLITRTDSTTQVAYNGLPLYYFQGDAHPGDVNGQAVGNVWWLATPGLMSTAAPAAPIATPAPATPAAGGTVNVELGDFYVKSDVTTFKVGQTYTFQITNAGDMTHELVVENAGDIDKPLEVNGKELEAEHIAAGASATLTVTFSDAGTYQLACHIAGHYANGMALTIHVVD